MLIIDRLSLRLPAGFASRATQIARLTARALAHRPLAGSAPGEVRVPPVRIPSGLGDRQVAAQISAAIHAALDAPATPSGGSRSC